MNIRGDHVGLWRLGIETPIASIPLVQKRIIEAANRKGKMVITTTNVGKYDQQPLSLIW